MTSRARLAGCAAALCAIAAAALVPGSAAAYEYPTAARVIYVQQCIRDNPGPYYEMIEKCSCALDHIAKTVTYDDFVSMETSTNATTIAGERGNAIRDAENLQKEIRTFRTLQAEAKTSCFIGFMQQVH